MPKVILKKTTQYFEGQSSENSKHCLLLWRAYTELFFLKKKKKKKKKKKSSPEDVFTDFIERGKKKHQWVASHTRDLTHNLGMYPDRESNLPPFGV